MGRRPVAGLVSLGCPKNKVDGEAMLGLLAEAGFEITGDARHADAIIVNTCGFIDSAKKESIGAILDMAEMKSAGRCRALIVTGCLSERFRGEFAENMPEVDAVLGTREYGMVAEAAMSALRQNSEERGENDGCEPDGTAGERSPSGTAGEPGSPRRTAGEPGSPALACVAGTDAATAQTTVPASPAHAPPALTTDGMPACGDPRFSHLAARSRIAPNSTYAYLKIAEGCDNRCSYCVIPSLRGGYASRPAADILEEARRVSDMAGRPLEFVLVAQDTTRYSDPGIRLGSSPEPTRGLPGLMRALARVDGVQAIRVLYCYPDLVDERLAAELAENPKTARYLDIPIQHASDSTLRLMNRRYGRALLERMVTMLRNEAPGIALRTTVMTGFPQETDADFNELLGFLAWARFERLGCFTYSQEDGAPAALMHGQTPRALARRRRARILALQKPIAEAASASRIGERCWAAIEQAATPGSIVRNTPIPGARLRPMHRYLARTYAEAPEIDGFVTLLSDTPLEPGGFVDAMVTGARSDAVEAVALRAVLRDDGLK